MVDTQCTEPWTGSGTFDNFENQPMFVYLCEQRTMKAVIHISVLHHVHNKLSDKILITVSYSLVSDFYYG